MEPGSGRRPGAWLPGLVVPGLPPLPSATWPDDRQTAGGTLLLFPSFLRAKRNQNHLPRAAACQPVSVGMQSAYRSETELAVRPQGLQVYRTRELLASCSTLSL